MALAKEAELQGVDATPWLIALTRAAQRGPLAGPLAAEPIDPAAEVSVPEPLVLPVAPVLLVVPVPMLPVPLVLPVPVPLVPLVPAVPVLVPALVESDEPEPVVVASRFWQAPSDVARINATALTLAS